MKTTRPTDRELLKVGAATLAQKYGVPVSQIVLWRKEARGRLETTDPNRDLLETLLAQEPGPARDRPEDFLGPDEASGNLVDPGPGYFNVRSGGQHDAIRTPSYRAYKPDPVTIDEPAADSYAALLWAIILAVFLIGLIVTGVWR